MAILKAETTSAQTTPPRNPPPFRPGLFLRTLIPKSSTVCAISLSLLPPHALTRHSSTTPLSSARQLVTSHSNYLSVYAVSDSTQSLIPLCTTPLFTPVIALASLPSPIPSRDVLLALTAQSKVAFLKYDDPSRRLALTGDVTLPHPAHLIATHPIKPLVAVSTLDKSITVFPLLFLPKSIAAGKLTTIALAGTPLSLTFLYDDGGPDAVLLVLQQRVDAQVLTLFTITPTPDGLSVMRTASMIPCATRPEDVAVARAASKLTGEPLRPVPNATAVTRLGGCPYMFAVFVQGKVAAGDAKPVLTGALEGNPGPMTVRLDNEEQNYEHAQLLLELLSERRSGGEAVGTPQSGVSDAPPVFGVRRGGRYGMRRGGGEDYLSYLSVPSYITLAFGEGGEGIVSAWSGARNHFRDEVGDGDGLYFVTEEGLMFVLRWSETAAAGLTTYRIPGDERTRGQTSNFWVQYVGDVGPAVSIAVLDRRLLFVANDGADGTLRKLHMPKVDLQKNLMQGLMGALRKRGVIGPNDRRFGLEVKQVFMNLAPILDFVIVPPQTRRDGREKRSRGVFFDGRNKQIYGRFEEREDALRSGASSVVQRLDASFMDIEEVAPGHGSKQRHLCDFRTLAGEVEESEGNDSAVAHVLHGSMAESEIVMCCGFGRLGSIRLIRPGAPVSIYASSAKTFVACNDMFSIRFTRDSAYHAGVALTFAQSTGILYSVPVEKQNSMDKLEMQDNLPTIAKLIDGTEATGLQSNVRTISIGALEDGVLAQVYETGIRVIFLKAVDKMPTQRVIYNGVLAEAIYERTLFWTPPDGGFISVGTIGAGFALVCVIQGGSQRPLLCLLKLFPGDFSKGLCMVSSVRLERELSSITIPEWTTAQADIDLVSPQFPPMAILGTYLPSVEVRLLGPLMEVLDRRMTYPWSLDFSRKSSSTGKSEFMSEENIATKLYDGEQSEVMSSDGKKRPSRSTAVPESLCALELNNKRLIFAGLRDGSVICFSFADAESAEVSDPGSPSMAGHLVIDSHRKLGHRPVVLKSATVAIGDVVIGQTDRPWMCTSVGGGQLRWIPLSFTETSALCAYSILGAERCLAVAAEDGALHICGIRRQSEVSVRSIHVGATPRRVLSVSNPEDSVVVATSKGQGTAASSHEKAQRVASDLWSGMALHEGYVGRDYTVRQSENAELRVYNRKLKVETGSKMLLPGEQVHLLLNWLGFVVVGTSTDIQTSRSSGYQTICREGRLRLYSLLSKGAAASSSTVPRKTKFSLCSEVVLPGAVLSGAVHTSASVLVVSCNEEVIVFGVLKSGKFLVEISRVSTRALVVSISICDDVICVVDRKDSVAFYRLREGKLVRDRSDYRRRIVSDAVMVDRSLAIAVDRRGAFFSIGYDEGDTPTVSSARLDICTVHNLLGSYENLAAAGQGDEGPLGNQSGNGLSSDGLGEEFDVIHPESSSENTTESNEQGQQFETSTEDATQASQGSDHIMVADSGESQGESASGNTNGVDGTQDGGTNTANPTQSTEENGPAVGQPNIAEVPNPVANVMNQATGAGASGTASRHEPQIVQRNLVCHHSFNMRDTSLRIRHGAFNRNERMHELSDQKQTGGLDSSNCRGDFFREASSAVFCATLGGALVAAVPISVETFALLSQAEAELSVHPAIAGPALGSSHKRFRAAYGSRAEGVVDGDLLNHLDSLDRSSKLDICGRLGYPGEEGMLYIEAIIRDLFDRVG